MSTNLIAAKAQEVEQKLTAVVEGHENFKALVKKAAGPEEAAKIALGLAFTLNSLFYSMVRVQGNRGQTVLQEHPVLDQIQHVKERYVKLNKATQSSEKA